MTTEERLENLERELARAKRRNRRLLICAAVCLGMIFAWVFFAQPGLLGTAQAADPVNPYEAEIIKLRAEVNLLKRDNERLREELDEAKKAGSAAAPTDAQGPSTPQPVDTQPPGPDKTPTAVSIPGLPETDSSWWRDPVALAKHMQLRFAMSATKPQASVWMWLQRNNYFVEQPMRWEVWLDNNYNAQDNNSISGYVNKDSASIEYYKCLDEAEKIGKEVETYSKEGVSQEEIDKKVERDKARAAWFRGEAKAWKILMDAGGGVSLSGSTTATQNEADLPVFRVHLVFPGGRSKAGVVLPGPDGKPVPLSTAQYPKVLVQGKIIALGEIPTANQTSGRRKSAATSAGLTGLQAALTGRVSFLFKNEAPTPKRETLEEHEAAQRGTAPPSRVGPTAPPAPQWQPCPSCNGSGTSTFICGFCNGTGKSGDPPAQCGFCRGRGSSPCTRCNGKGMVQD